MNKKKSICLIIVNYNSENEVLNLIDSIDNDIISNNLDIIIIDNSDQQKNKQNRLKKNINKKINYIKAKNNIGYFGGAQLGLKSYIKNNSGVPDFLIISNPDITLKNNLIFEKLNYFNYDSDIGIIAPSIFSKRLKRDKNPKIFKRPSNYKMHFYKFFFKSQFLQNLYILIHIIKNRFFGFFKDIIMSLKNKKNNISLDLLNIYAPHGSFIIITQNYFNKGGTINYPCFLFNEEVFIAEMARRLNLRVVYDNEIKILDDEHIATGLFRSKRIAKYVAESSKYIANKYFK